MKLAEAQNNADFVRIDAYRKTEKGDRRQADRANEKQEGFVHATTGHGLFEFVLPFSEHLFDVRRLLSRPAATRWFLSPR